MNELIEKLIASNFADLQGLEIKGRVPIKEELMNEAVATVLRDMVNPSAPAPAATPAAAGEANAPSAPKVNPRELLKLLTSLNLEAQEGQVVLNFEIRR